MEQYISKSAVVAEIKNRRDSFYSLSKSCEKGTPAKAGFYAQAQTLEGILSFLDTLEVKEVDEEYNGRAMLYVLEKGVKQGRRELIENACKWWEEELSYPSMTQEEIKWYKSKVNKFRKAMEE